MISMLAAGVIAPFFFKVTPEIRSTYQSLGKIVEDRPMQVTSAYFGWDSGLLGRFFVGTFDVNSLTDRRSDVHRHMLYHTEFGPMWELDVPIVDGWFVRNGVCRYWTLYRGFEDESANKTYHWWQWEQSLENPYLVPYYRMRRYFRGSEYFYFKVGVRRKFGVWGPLSLTPSIFAEGGNARNYKKLFGENVNGGSWGVGGVSSVSFRLEAAYELSTPFSLFCFVEQYEVVGADARDSNEALDYDCAHNDWTIYGIGFRASF